MAPSRNRPSAPLPAPPAAAADPETVTSQRPRGPSWPISAPQGPSPTAQSGASPRGASLAEQRRPWPMGERRGPSALTSRSGRRGAGRVRVGFRSRRRARVAGAGGSGRRGACGGARRRHRVRREASFPLRFPPGKPGGGSARSLPPPAAAGERPRPSSPVTRGAGPSARRALGLVGRCRRDSAGPRRPPPRSRCRRRPRCAPCWTSSWARPGTVSAPRP